MRARRFLAVLLGGAVLANIIIAGFLLISRGPGEPGWLLKRSSAGLGAEVKARFEALFEAFPGDWPAASRQVV